MIYYSITRNTHTDPNNPDTDNDTLTDGYEMIINTNPSNNDTDSDSVLDGEEIDLWLDPRSNDTDGDKLTDLKELTLGTNPLSKDTDNDGVNDFEDTDSYTSHVERVILAYDQEPGNYEFVDNLARYTNVTVVSPGELISNYSDAQYIVLVGRPDAGNGTVGNITHNLLRDSGEILTKMMESDYYRRVTGYGIWNSTQTIVMISHPYHSDQWRVLNILKSLNVTVLPDSVRIEYSSPRNFFTAESIKEIDSYIWVDLEKAVTPWVKMERFNASTTPMTLGSDSGLEGNEKATGRYFQITVSDNVQNETKELINWAMIKFYYTASDLDRTGNGDASDGGDINESTLKMYYFNESAGNWTKIIEDPHWVFETGVNTTNVELYGKSYEGYVWANISHFSLFGLSGETRPFSVTSGGGSGEGTKPTIIPTQFTAPTPSIISTAIPVVTGAISAPVETQMVASEPSHEAEPIIWIVVAAFALLIAFALVYLRKYKKRKL